jgi:hypothetical protein
LVRLPEHAAISAHMSGVTSIMKAGEPPGWPASLPWRVWPAV